MAQKHPSERTAGLPSQPLDSFILDINVARPDSHQAVPCSLEMVWPLGQGMAAWHLLLTIGNYMGHMKEQLRRTLVATGDVSLAFRASGGHMAAQSISNEQTALAFNSEVKTEDRKDVLVQIVLRWPTGLGIHLLDELEAMDTSQAGPLRQVRSDLIQRLISDGDASLSHGATSSLSNEDRLAHTQNVADTIVGLTGRGRVTASIE